jgi:signal transduction histidine kinase
MLEIKSRIKGIALKFDQEYSGEVSSIPKNVIGDKRRFQQVLINLVSNAIAYTFDGEVTISCGYDKTE